MHGVVTSVAWLYTSVDAQTALLALIKKKKDLIWIARVFVIISDSDSCSMGNVFALLMDFKYTSGITGSNVKQSMPLLRR